MKIKVDFLKLLVIFRVDAKTKQDNKKKLRNWVINRMNSKFTKFISLYKTPQIVLYYFYLCKVRRRRKDIRFKNK